MADIQQIEAAIRQYRSVSFIGMAKNAGKTTTLNFFLNRFWNHGSLGLTSIGRDGEMLDEVTATPKPRIYVPRNTVIATTKICLGRSDITKEVLQTTGIHTPLGEVIIVRALSDGYVEIAGPSQVGQLRDILTTFGQLGVGFSFVDGALSRKTFASPQATEATVLATGASVSPSLDQTVAKTAFICKLLGWEHETRTSVVQKAVAIKNLGLIYDDLSFRDLPITTLIDSAVEILPHLHDGVRFIVLNGVVSDALLKSLMRHSPHLTNFTLIARDGTKLFLTEPVLHKYLKSGGTIRVLHPIKVIGVSVNPFSPAGYQYDPIRFIRDLQAKIAVPVFNVKDFPEAAVPCP